VNFSFCVSIKLNFIVILFPVLDIGDHTLVGMNREPNNKLAINTNELPSMIVRLAGTLIDSNDFTGLGGKRI
jgi:hypothetical protein